MSIMSAKPKITENQMRQHAFSAIAHNVKKKSSMPNRVSCEKCTRIGTPDFKNAFTRCIHTDMHAKIYLLISAISLRSNVV